VNEEGYGEEALVVEAAAGREECVVCSASVGSPKLGSYEARLVISDNHDAQAKLIYKRRKVAIADPLQTSESGFDPLLENHLEIGSTARCSEVSPLRSRDR